MVNKKNIPLGIKLVSIYFFIGAVLDIISGLMLIFSKESVINIFPVYLQDFYYFLIPFQIGLGIFEFFLGKALWNTKKWARIAVFIVSGFQIIMSALMIQENLANSITHIILYTTFISYLFFSKKAKKEFR